MNCVCVRVKHGSRLWHNGIRLAYADLRIARVPGISVEDWLDHTGKVLHITRQPPGQNTYQAQVTSMVSTLITKVALMVEQDHTIFNVGNHNILIFHGLLFIGAS